MNRRTILLTLLVLLALIAPAAMTSAQTPVPSDSARLPVTVQAHDGLTLNGQYSPTTAQVPEEGAPTVLLLHMLRSNLSSWDALVPSLVEAGFNVLAVDLRGHGNTGGMQNWNAALIDVQTWLDWLRQQPGVRPDAISIMGASIGANLALMGCANDPDCLTVVALSPGENYGGLQPGTVLDALEDRSILLVSSRGDRESLPAVTQFAASAPGHVGLNLYPGNAHGTNLFAELEDFFIEMLLCWFFMTGTPFF